MSKPPFTMSKYANELDLQRDARKYYQNRCDQLREVAEAMRDWIDSVPNDIELPAMPGFDRDWADSIIDTDE